MILYKAIQKSEKCYTNKFDLTCKHLEIDLKG